MNEELSDMDIASVCHDANRAYCKVLGDHSQPKWMDAPKWQWESAELGVKNIREGKITTASESHQGWLEQKKADGWVYGERKDPEAKEHPCMVEFGMLPAEQRVKDTLFFAIATALLQERT